MASAVILRDSTEDKTSRINVLDALLNKNFCKGRVVF